MNVDGPLPFFTVLSLLIFFFRVIIKMNTRNIVSLSYYVTLFINNKQQEADVISALSKTDRDRFVFEFLIRLPKEKISGFGKNVRFFWDLLKNHTMWHFDFTEVCGIHWTNPLCTIVIDTIFDRCTNTQVPIHSESIVLRFVSARPTRVHNLRSRIWVEVK